MLLLLLLLLFCFLLCGDCSGFFFLMQKQEINRSSQSRTVEHFLAVVSEECGKPLKRELDTMMSS